jgi:hypothetical protein
VLTCLIFATYEHLHVLWCIGSIFLHELWKVHFLYVFIILVDVHAKISNQARILLGFEKILDLPLVRGITKNNQQTKDISSIDSTFTELIVHKFQHP